jgi:hypothetical protein
MAAAIPAEEVIYIKIQRYKISSPLPDSLTCCVARLLDHDSVENVCYKLTVWQHNTWDIWQENISELMIDYFYTCNFLRSCRELQWFWTFWRIYPRWNKQCCREAPKFVQLILHIQYYWVLSLLHLMVTLYINYHIMIDDVETTQYVCIHFQIDQNFAYQFTPIGFISSAIYCSFTRQTNQDCKQILLVLRSDIIKSIGLRKIKSFQRCKSNCLNY